MDTTILLTGTIAPKDVPFLARTDPKLRLRDYITSIFRWVADSPVNKIIFCENSNYDYDFALLKDLANAYSKELEIIQFQGCNGASTYGKSYGESKLINYALDNSKLLTSSKDFYKITGRLYIENIKQILQLHENNEIVFSRDKRGNSVDTRFFKVSKKFYSTVLFEVFNEINDNEGKSLEHVYHDKLIHHGNKVTHLSKLPIYIGISGSGGAVYSKPSAWFKFRRELSIKLGKYNFNS